MDSEKLLDSFLQFEDEYEMFELKVGKVKVWHYMRLRVFISLIEIFGLGEIMLDVKTKQDTASDERERSIKVKLFRNQFLAHRRDVLIIPHTRKYKEEDGYYRCIYTDLLDKAMTRSHYILDPKSAEGVYARQRSKNILYVDINAFNDIYKVPQKYLLMDKGQMEKDIIAPLEKYYNITIFQKHKQKWLNTVNGVLKSRWLWINYYSYMLRKIRPKVIIMTIAYAPKRMILCETAKKMNIPVVELQHGTINRTAVQYNFGKKMNLSTFPDYVFTFGQLEKSVVRFPIDNNRIIPTGFPELENSYKYYSKEKKKLEKEKKQILFISQGLIEIAQYAAVAAEMLDSKEYGIIFKLHPKEYGNWKNTYGTYLDNPNIEVVGDFNRTIHSFLAEADWVVGSYSTVLYEATMFDVKIAVIKTALYSGMKALYDNGHAILVDSPQRLADIINKDTFRMNSMENLFTRNSLEIMLEWIEKIIYDKEVVHSCR